MTVGFPLSFGTGSTFRPTFTSPGVPGQDYVVGRTSTNQLRVAVTNGSPILSNLSTTSVTIGTGSKVFTINTALSSFSGSDVNNGADNITLASHANNANFMKGTVTSLVGSTLTINVTSVGGSGTFTDWECIIHLPSNCSYDGSVTGLRTGSNSTNFSIVDWDFRGMNSIFFLQNTHSTQFSQCLFDLSGYSISGTPAFMSQRSGTGDFSIDHCTFDGLNSIYPVSCFGGGLVTCQYSDCINWPVDWMDGGAVSGKKTTIQYNRVNVASTATTGGLHADCIQITSWGDTTGLDIHHNVFSIPATTPPGSGTLVNSCINIGSNSGDILAPVTINNCILSGGGYQQYFENKHNGTPAGSITVGGNVYGGGWNFGPTYSGSAAGWNFVNLTIQGIKSSSDGSTVLFFLNENISTSSVTIGTGAKTFTVTSGLTNLVPSASITIFESANTASMTGTITSYSGTTLILNISSASGSGTFSSWAVSFNSVVSYP